MLMTWVNHASFILQSAKVRLICDPWIEGRTFNDGWQLVSPSQFRYENFADITHIWFSHEHPDHFLPPNLKRIPESIRRNITVLFHETRDKRVIKVCQGLGFKTRELPNLRKIEIAEDFSVVCGLNDLIDSWIAIFADGKTILNLNDCVFPSKQELVGIRLMTGEIDLLLSQFSYANWVGNPEDFESQKASAKEKRQQMAEQIEITRPRHFVPFASYIFFCHDENFFMNRHVNRVGDTYRFLATERGQDTVVLYPGDQWKVGTPHDSTKAIACYESDFAAALASVPVASKSSDLPTLSEMMSKLIAKCVKNNNSLLLNAIPSSVVRLSDLGIDVEISFRRGLRPVTGKLPDIVTSSNNLFYCLTTDWGGDTLKINGRFSVLEGGLANRFFQIFRVPQYNSYGDSLNISFVAGRLMDRFRRASVASAL
jgi:hypothetical protein